MDGKLSTHVLDNYLGKPATGIGWALYSLEGDGEWELVSKGKTNTDGRTDSPLLIGAELETGKYKLSFEVASYYSDLKVEQSSPPFLETVSIEVNLVAEQSYHVPLLMTPWSYSTYRGS